MAYTAFEFQLVVRGHLALGEIWTNTWTFDDAAGLGDRADAIADLRQFYTDLTGFWSTLQAADSCTLVELANHTSNPVTWAAIVGTAGGSPLPQECASRVSLDDLAGHRGGPFLPSSTTAGLSTSGLMTTTYQDAIADAVVNLNANLSGHDINLRIDRPTVPSTVPANRVRIGLVWDAIRSRRSALSESYDVRSL